MQHTAQRGKPMQAANFAHPVRNVALLDVEKGMKVADFGSGSGAYVLALASRLGAEGRVYAVDVQRDLLRRTYNEALKRGYHNVGIVWADLEREGASKLAGGSLDLVLISNLLFQLEEKTMVFREARRVLKQSGQLVVIDWSDSFHGMGPIKEHVVTKARALELAKKAGFELAREFEAGAHHYGLVFRPAKAKV